MIKALKITADRIAVRGLVSRMTLNTFSAGYVAANVTGMMAKSDLTERRGSVSLTRRRQIVARIVSSFGWSAV